MSSDSAFPRWLKRLDPFLEAEDANALFEAFRARRAKRGARGLFSRGIWWPWRRNLIRSAIIAAMLLWGLLFVVSISIAPLRPYLILFVVLFVALFWAASRYSRVRSIPNSLIVLMGDVRTWEQAAYDVWMTGTSAREVAVGVYLESRERSWKIELGVVAVFVMLALASLLAWRGRIVWGTPILTAGFVYLGWQLFAYCAASAGCTELKTIVSKWKISLTSVPQQIEQALMILLCVAVGVPLVLMLLGGLMAGLEGLAPWTGSLLVAWWRLLPPEVHGGLATGMVGGLLHVSRRRAFRKKLRRFNKLATEFDGLYDRYMRRFVIHDTAAGS